MNKYKLGIIGAGNMSTAIWKGVIASGICKPNEVIVSDLDSNKLAIASEAGLSTTNDNLLLANSVEYLLFAVKPQSFGDIANSLNGKLGDVKIISIMAGVKIATLKEKLSAKKVCRVMPNTPCMVQKGMSALCFDNYQASEKIFPLEIFSGIGEIIEMSEQKFDAVTSVSGSGPAYVYMFIQGMIQGGINGGLTYEEAKKLTIATFRGGAEMIAKNDKPIDDLIDAVCSKGGTTIQAVNHYRNASLVDIIAEGVDRCRARSVEMGCSGGETLVTMYTDGACNGNPGPGGWCCILNASGTEKVLSGGEKDTTNNRMELLAVIEGLKALTKRCIVEVYSDSAYVVNAVTNNWVYGWKNKGWDNIKNPDLWVKLLSLLQTHDVRFIKVKGHSDNELNNRCDAIARQESKNQNGKV